MRPGGRLTSAVLKVGDSRGFVVKRRARRDHVVITAAHCLPNLPVPDPGREVHEQTFARLLGPLGAEPTVSAECFFVDPIADIAVLGAPDYQEMNSEAVAFETLVERARPLAVADTPGQNHDGSPGENAARVLSLDGRWRDGRVLRMDQWLSE